MRSPRPSIFRDALQVSPERIAALGDADLNELMKDLLQAQAHRCRSSLAAVRVNTEDKAKDGGCDGWTDRPEVDDDWLGDADTCWQFKAGVAGERAKLKGEVIKPIPKTTLEANGRFVVVASGSTRGKPGEDQRLKMLQDEADAAGIPTSKIVVIGSERLTTWCNQNPAVAARWAGRPEGMWTLADWSSAEVHQVPWQASDAVEANLASQRAALDFESGSVQHLHIHGQPGVGKTRFALELCRAAPWSASIIYVQQATDLRLSELIDSAAAEPAVRLVVVADEVQPEQLRPLRDSIGRANGRLRLITIGHCPTPDPSRIPALAVTPLDQEMASKVVKGWYPAMPTEHVAFVVCFAAGYVRLAWLAADAVARNGAIDIRGLLSRDAIRGFLDGMLGTGDRRALHVVAILSSVGWTDDKQTEGEAVARHLGLDWNDVRAKVEDYHRRLGIAPRGGRYRYISPTPLGIHLAVEAWTTYPDLLRTLPDVLPTEGAKDAYYERLQSMASNPQVRGYARQELANFVHLDDFVDVRAVRRWSAMSAADPEQAARNILCTLSRSRVEGRSRIADRARRETVWTLVRLAWRPGAFADAAKALAMLGEAENETWTNNATSEFVGRFQIFLGGTAVPYLDRLSILDELADENRATLTRLVVKALAVAGRQHVSRMVSAPPSDELPEEEWHPSSGREHLQCIQAALDRLTVLADRADPELQEDFITAAKNFVMMLRKAPGRPLVERFFDAVRGGYPDAREPLRRAIADVVHHERNYWKELSQEELAELDAVHARFEEPSLKARLRQQVGPHPWGREEQPDLRPLAKELLESAGALTEEWPWLTSGDAADAWRFGEALAEEDPERTLATSVTSLSEAGRDLRVLCGYISGWRRKLGDDWYEQWVQSQLTRRPRPANVLFEVAWRCGATAAVAHHVADVLRTESVAPEIVGQLGYSGWGKELEPDLLEDVLRAMVDCGHRTTALTMLEQRIKAAPADLERWRQLALELITSPELIRSDHTTSYHWKELALRFVSGYPAEIAAAIFREQGARSADIWFAENSEAAEVLQACVRQDPSAVWAALLPWLSSKSGAYMFSIRFPRGVVERASPEQVLAWVDEQPGERAWIIAKFVSKNLSSDETLAARVLGAYGDKDDVASEFFAEYMSGSWSGPASTHWEQLAAVVNDVARQTRLPKLRKWATDAARELRRMAERDRQSEEEEELRGR